MVSASSKMHHLIAPILIKKNVIKRTVPLMTILKVSIMMTLADAVLGEFDAGEDIGVVLAGGNPGAVAATVDKAFNKIG